MSFQASALILAWVTILLLALAMSGLIRQIRHLSSLVEADATAVGARQPGGRGPLAGARPPGVEELVSAFGSPLGIVFASDACSSCAARLAELRQSIDGSRRLVVVRRRAPDDAPTQPDSGLPEVSDPELFRAFHVTMTPTAFTIGDDGSVRHAVPLGSRSAVQRFTQMMKEL